MADLNDTLKDDPNEVKDQVKTRSEIFPCEKCDKIFEKKGKQSLHMRKPHNIKTLQYTPAPRKVSRPTNRFICKTCQDKINESELGNHLIIMHGRARKGLTDTRATQKNCFSGFISS